MKTNASNFAQHFPIIQNLWSFFGSAFHKIIYSEHVEGEYISCSSLQKMQIYGKTSDEVYSRMEICLLRRLLCSFSYGES